MKCCNHCFNDRTISEIFSLESKLKGTCDFCDTADAPLLEPNTFSLFFETLFDAYDDSEDSDLKSTVKLLKDHWGLFENIKEDKAVALLKAIFSENVTGITFSKNPEETPPLISEWDAFREELKHKNRFFPKVQLDLKTHGELFGYLTDKSMGNKDVYRARINQSDTLYSNGELGISPKELATNGRANPIGIPCLYVATDIDTAIAEVRPHKGEYVTVAEYRLPPALEFADLRNPQKTISPFILEDDKIKLLMHSLPYLSMLGKDLSKPIIPNEAHLEYLPSQYLCEFIKRCGFKGVIYKSSVGQGSNIAIFNDNDLPIQKKEIHLIKEVEFKHKIIS